MSTLRVLFWVPFMPEYDREGGSLRIFHHVEFLRSAGCAVTFLAQNGTNGERCARLLRRWGVETYFGPDSLFTGDEYLPDILTLLTVAKFDVAILPFWFFAESKMPILRKYSPHTKIVVDSVDLHFLRRARLLLRGTKDGRISRGLDSAYADEMRREINAYAAADAVFAVSQKEADLVNDLVGSATLAYAVPLADEMNRSTVPFIARKGILFIGSFRHPPNVEALTYLCKDILPHIDAAILAEHPVYVVGNALDQGVAKCTTDIGAVQLVGWVPSLLPYLEHCRVSVIPLLHGAGTKQKLLQALMSGIPSVSTSIGIEGYGLVHGEHVLVADDAAAFADSVITLLWDEALWRRLALTGHSHISTLHSKGIVKERFLAVVAEILQKQPKWKQYSTAG